MIASLKHVFKLVIASLLEWEARLVLAKYKPRVIAVTGSVGKTSAKDAIYAVLQSSYFVRRSEKSFNSEVGIPLTILGCPNAWSNPFLWVQNLLDGLALILFRNEYPKWLVLEIGADRPGDIRKLSRWIPSDIVVVTRLPEVPVHVEYFESPEALFKEKSYAVRQAKQKAVTILNADDARVMAFSAEARGEILTFGLTEGATVSASHIKALYRSENGRTFPEGMTFRVDHGGRSVPISLYGILGTQSVYAALAGITVGVSCGVNLVEAGQALAKMTTAPGRMRLIEGLKGTLLIDDTYNASPVAEEEALAALSSILPPQTGEGVGRKIAVLGDMLELGRYSADEHKQAGKRAAEICNFLITVGFRARYIAEGALAAGMHESKILQFEDAEEAGEALELMLEQGDVVLVKGSQSMRMEKTVEAVMAHPEDKEKLLVRQEKEWVGR